jgi:hypothetical protein
MLKRNRSSTHHQATGRNPRHGVLKRTWKGLERNRAIEIDSMAKSEKKILLLGLEVLEDHELD